MVKLHPTAIRLLKKGHPWVLKDEFTERFPLKDSFLVGTDQHDNPVAFLIHDPNHPKIKARIWSRKIDPHFIKTLSQRLRESCFKRKKKHFKRENYYLAFGEADFLPGLFIQKLGSRVLIQYELLFWEEYLKEIKSTLSVLYPKSVFWTQFRKHSQSSAYFPQGKPSNDSFWIKENDLKLKVTLGKSYDHGLYTDMASIREQVHKRNLKPHSVLNLFAYTGAWSLMALQMGARKVYSNDLSKTYLSWLEENLCENTLLAGQEHVSLLADAVKIMNDFIRRQDKVDLLICDPPSTFTDKKKRMKAFQFYQKNLPLFKAVVKPGGSLLLFLNTHSIPLKKFSNLFKGFSLQQTFTLGDDCPTVAHFPEGDYLKGLLLKNNVR